MTVEELGDKLMDKSSEVYWEHCGEYIQDEDSYLASRYWEGWSDALEWCARAIRDGCLDVFELKRPIVIGEHNIEGKHKLFYKYPPDWSEAQKEAWRTGKPVCLGAEYVNGERQETWLYPDGWSLEQMKEWSREHEW